MSTQLKWAISLVVVMLFISYEQYTLEDRQSYQKPPSSYKDLNTSVFKGFLKQPSTTTPVAHLWGLSETSEQMKKRLSKNDESDEQKKAQEIAVTKTKNSLCIEKSCYRLLGFYKQNRDYVSFFNKDIEPHIKTITKGENLNSLIELESINKNIITLSEINATRKWQFKLFDVNTTKYKPKKETR